MNLPVRKGAFTLLYGFLLAVMPVVEWCKDHIKFGLGPIFEGLGTAVAGGFMDPLIQGQGIIA